MRKQHQAINMTKTNCEAKIILLEKNCHGTESDRGNFTIPAKEPD